MGKLFRHCGQLSTNVRRSYRLKRVRKELEHRGISVAGLSDAELEAAIQGGHETLEKVHLDGGDATAAFFTVVQIKS